MKQTIKLKQTIAISIALCMIAGLAGCSKKEESSDTKIKVNDQVITVGEYDKRLQQTMQTYEAQYGEELWDKEIENGKTYKEYIEEMLLDTMILEIVIAGEAKNDGIEITDEKLQEEFAKYKEYFTSTDEYNKFLKENSMTEESLLETLKKELLIEEFLSKKSESIDALEPTEDELKSLYDDKKIIFDKIQASHILVDEESKSKEIKEKLDSGANFEELAKEFSTCPSSAEGGDLGYFAYGDMLPEFSEAAFAMDIGQISEPVKSSYGYHIIKVTDIKNSYELVDREELIYQYKALKYNEMLDNYIENAKIEK